MKDTDFAGTPQPQSQPPPPISTAGILAICGTALVLGVMALVGLMFWRDPAQAVEMIRTTGPAALFVILIGSAIGFWCLIFHQPLEMRSTEAANDDDGPT